MATADAHQGDPLMIGGTTDRDDASAALGRRLDALPNTVRETKRFPLGRYRGLAFGLVLHPGSAAEVFLDGAASRHGMLSRDHRGPKAVLNALDRLAGSYQGQCQAARQELAIAEGQLRDHEARIGRLFPHDGYRVELIALRDQLKAGLSQATPEKSIGLVPVPELAARIIALKAANTVEAAPERPAARRIVAEEPVTARIRRIIASPAFEPLADPVIALVQRPDAEDAPTDGRDEPTKAVIDLPPRMVEAATARSHIDYRQQIAGGSRGKGYQPRLF